MSKETVTGATVDNPEVTDDPEEPESAESVSQDSTAKLEEFEAKLKDFSSQLETALKAKANAEAKAVAQEEARKAAEEAKGFEERKYKGLQRETNQKSDAIKRLEAQVAAQTATQTQLNKIEKFVAKLAETQLDPSVIEQFTREFEYDVQKKEIERLQAQAAAQVQTVTQQPKELSPEQKHYYYGIWFQKDFPEVNPLDSSLDWHLDVTTDQEWLNAMRAEFTQRKSRLVQTPTVDNSTEVKAEIEAKLAAQQEEAEKKMAEIASKLQETQKELNETRRLQQEQLNRQKGMDRNLESIGEPSTTPSVRKIRQELASLNDDDLYSKDPKVRDAYTKKVNDKTLRDRLVAASFTQQSK